ncbi:MAG: chorismate synthase [Chitinophagales bacterium]
MAGNSFGSAFRITTFGESHGPAIGVVVDGCPAALEISVDFIQSELDRRKPGTSVLSSPRKEADQVEVLSGLYKGKTLGSPITLLIRNSDVRSVDYENLEHLFRPSHADFTYEMKYGFRDHRGGGRSSARETAARVAAGAIAKTLLKKFGIEIAAYVSAVGHLQLLKTYNELNLQLIESNAVRCPDQQMAAEMQELIEQVKSEGDTLGGVITTVIKNVPIGLGEPVFDKLHADLGKAMLSINAVHGFEYGSGFAGAAMRGSTHNDVPKEGDSGKIYRSEHNYSGGILGGISNGENIYFRTAFKPVATLMREQQSIDKKGEKVTFQTTGRHDACVVPRAVPIVEAMAALVLADHLLRSKLAVI